MLRLVCVVAVSIPVLAIAGLWQPQEPLEQPVGPQVGELAWLTGSWHMDDGDRHWDEVWLPAAHGSISGMTRFVHGGLLQSYSIMTFEQDSDDRLVLRSRHFSPSLKTWAQEADGPMEFEITALGEDTMSLQHVKWPLSATYRRVVRDGAADELHITFNEDGDEFSLVLVNREAAGR